MKNVITLAALAGLSSAALAGVPSTVADFGLIVDSASATATIPAFEVDVFWASFQLSGTETYLDITTAIGTTADTEIGLFNSSGDLLASNDDIGLFPQTQSLLSFGTGSGMDFGSGATSGADGGMWTPGTYYVAFGGFDITFSNGFGASSTFFDFDDQPVTLTIFAGVPTPASASLLALGGLVGMRRRR